MATEILALELRDESERGVVLAALDAYATDAARCAAVARTMPGNDGSWARAANTARALHERTLRWSAT